jgi:hypothetical protein
MALGLLAPDETPQRQRSSLRLPFTGALLILVLGMLGIVVVGGMLAGQSGSPCSATPAPAALPAPGTAGTTLQGKVSWFGGPHDSSAGPTTASGKPVTIPGIAVYDTATLDGYWWVSFPNGHAVVFQQTDVGPAPWTGRVLDVLYSALPYIGYTEQDFPTDGQITAKYLGNTSQAAHLAVGAGSSVTSTTQCAFTGGDGSAASIAAAANLLESMHVPYNYGGGHITPARPTAGQEGSYAGLDCSSSVSFVLQHAGIRVETLTSTGFMTWGEPGPGAQVTLYANTGHVFIKIGGRYFGTSGFGHPAAGTGPAWFTTNPSPEYLATFVARHPPGM